MDEWGYQVCKTKKEADKNEKTVSEETQNVIDNAKVVVSDVDPEKVVDETTEKNEVKVDKKTMDVLKRGKVVGEEKKDLDEPQKR